MRTVIFFLGSSFFFGCDNSIPEDVPLQSDTQSETASSSDPGESDSGASDAESVDTGSSREESPPVDADGDGWFEGEDCDDLDDRIHPGSPEFCDGIDTDCDGRIDPPDAVDAPTWYRDADGDNIGSSTDTILSCTHPGSDWVAIDGDCDDTNDRVYPGAEEICDGLDNDCDGVVDPDDSVDATAWFFDADGDGHGVATHSMMACAGADSTWVAIDGDCDDTSSDIYPGAPEYCDAIDSDCDGTESTDIASFHASSGERFDVTDELDSPVISVTEAGAMHFCELSWTGQIDIDLDVEGSVRIEGYGNVVLDADGAGSVIEVNEGVETLEVRNLTLTGGSAIHGGAIYADGSDIFLEDVALLGNVANEYGGAIFVHEGDVELRSVEMTRNTSAGLGLGGGGIYVGVGDVLVMDSTLFDNHAEGWWSNGGAIYVLSGDILMKDSSVKENSASWQGGGFYVASGYLELVDSRLEKNVSVDGGGAYVAGDVLMIQSLFIDNGAEAGGGGLFLNTAGGASTFVCESMDFGAHGFLFNDSGSTGGAVHIASIEFTSISSEGCDWGSRASDNEGGDLRMAPFDAEAGLNATFSCEGLDCDGDIDMMLEP